MSGLERQLGFTLAELLVTLAILGIIATFTIPKVLQSQQNERYNAMAKEAFSIASGAYARLQLENPPTATTTAMDLTQYVNYINVNTASVIDEYYNNSSQVSINCISTNPCILLHNGGVMMFEGGAFGGTASTNAIVFYLDPDGKVTDGTTNGPGKSLKFFIYYNGRLATRESILPGTWNNGSSYNPVTNADPPWFS